MRWPDGVTESFLTLATFSSRAPSRLTSKFSVTNTKGQTCPAGAKAVGADTTDQRVAENKGPQVTVAPQHVHSRPWAKSVCVSLPLSSKSNTKRYCESDCIRKQGFCRSKKGPCFMEGGVLLSNGSIQKKQYRHRHRGGHVTLETEVGGMLPVARKPGEDLSMRPLYFYL